MRVPTAIAAAAAVFAAAVGITQLAPGAAPVAQAAELVPFTGCDDLLGWIRRTAGEHVGPYGLGGGPVAMPGLRSGAVDALAAGEEEAAAPAPAPAPAADAAQTTGEGGADFSGTNVQERGVDEPDVVKTDGRTLYVVHGTSLQVLDVTGAEPVLRASVALGDGWGHELLLHGDRLVVIGPEAEAHPAAVGGTPPAGAAGERMLLPDAGWPLEREVVRLTAFDVSDPAAPRQLGSATVPGSSRSARAVDGIARLVVHTPMTGPPMVMPGTQGAASEAEALAHNRQIVASSTLADWLPVGPDGAPLVPCERISRPSTPSGLGLLQVVTVDLAGAADGTLPLGGAAAVVADGETVYASTSRLYVATTRWQDAVVVGGDAFVPGGPVRTDLHAFDTTQPATVRYVGSGRVEGRLLSSYALSEHEGVLRVAVTRELPGPAQRPAPAPEPGAGPVVDQPVASMVAPALPPNTDNVVVTLGEGPDGLVELGRVEGLGRGEQIHAVRFMGDLAYVVTFRRTDPLYTVDLSDPSAPRVVGELKIPGYSAYLHPIGEGLLLGVGQDADLDGRVLGAQVSLFDVRDPAAPTRIATADLGAGTASTVEHDPHAFLWWAPLGMAVLPVERWGDVPGGSTWIGAVAVAAGPEGLREVGRVSHADALGPRAAQPEDVQVWDEGLWQAGIRRSVVVGDQLLTVSGLGVGAADAATLAPRAFVAFPPVP